MADSFSREISRVVAGQLAEVAGYESVQDSAAEVLGGCAAAKVLHHQHEEGFQTRRSNQAKFFLQARTTRLLPLCLCLMCSMHAV